MVKCGKKCEVYSRIVGYFRPVRNWNDGKKEEFKDRLEYEEIKSLERPFKNKVTGIEQKQDIKVEAGLEV